MGLLKTESLDNVIQNNSYFKEMHTLIDVKFPFSFVCSSLQIQDIIKRCFVLLIFIKWHLLSLKLYLCYSYVFQQQ